ncbi:MAG: 1-acyl-sn-glycerol-3-phosphate acyltransferase [Alphaproteobacteria bacterium]|nr:1-acyl-sn-glycerol-3-phosphate acyltransferase [Alphaproteobacteria bacterium]
MSAIRAGRILAGFFVLTVPLMPLQALFVRVSPKLARTFPNWYHRQVCRLLGIRLSIDGSLAADDPVLIISNHTSWLDIPVISAVAPVSFVAKKEVGHWPFVASLARLQRTVFVDRERRTAAGETAREIAGRLAMGDKLVLFAEGTSSDGNRVLPFRTSLFAAAKPSRANTAEAIPQATAEQPAPGGSRLPVTHLPVTQVQTLTICYTHLHGVPIARADRPLVGWYGDMEMGSHAWQLLKAGPLDVKISVGPPVPLADFKDRKELARHSETEIRSELVRILRGRGPAEPIELAEIPQEKVSLPVKQSGDTRNFV